MRRKNPDRLLSWRSRLLLAFCAVVTFLAACQEEKSRTHDIYGRLLPGDVDTAPPVARRFVALMRAQLTDSEPAVFHQATLCEPIRIYRELGPVEGGTLVQWVFRSVYTSRADSAALERLLASLDRASFAAGGQLCVDLADIVAAEAQNGVVPLLVSEAQRERVRRDFRERDSLTRSPRSR